MATSYIEGLIIGLELVILCLSFLSTGRITGMPGTSNDSPIKKSSCTENTFQKDWE